MENFRYVGVEPSGPKSDRSAIAVLDYYPKNQRVFVIDVDRGMQSDALRNADQVFVESLRDAAQGTSHFFGYGFHGPISLPSFFRDISERDRAIEQEWFDLTRRRLKPRPRSFLNYLQRPAEVYFRHLMPERFALPDGLGSNWAPIAARLAFVCPMLQGECYEVFPRATLVRLTAALGMPKRIARDYSQLEEGVARREEFFSVFSQRLPQLFIYEKDLEQMILELSCFHAFLVGFTLHLKRMDACEPRPPRFPAHATWIDIPKQRIDWNRVF